MGDVLSPFTVSAPPPPSSTPASKNNSMPMLYYGLVVVGTAAIVLALYNLIIIKRSQRRHRERESEGSGAIEGTQERISTVRGERNLLSSFKYKKEVEVDEYECPVCLSVYEEGEDVRKLPRCKHSFHVVCIDMWLYFHFDCPICRTPVGPFFCHNFPAVESAANP
ncbi:hypothetical protein RJT34_14951 [Clitoria ternatea]|uniref:RING-type domain-containing protein n=1 Tax=Clitoria ternatea TaxID=43366 RepID=A0AAN9JTN3_CLITE